MLTNYFKIAYRTLKRQKGYAALNVVGLALGMAVCLLIILLVQDQRSYDRWHDEADRIVRVLAQRTFSSGNSLFLGGTPAYLAPALARDVPAVEQTLRVGQIRADALAAGKGLHVDGLFAEPSFFDLFDFELVTGDAATAAGGGPDVRQ